ncbi:MAG: sodium/proline symporter PutP [Oscillospiraceae bacterium]|nr:sodium/proline symporter PutP [Oscillospiraceae bacterium]
MSGNDITMLITIAVYLVGMVVIGILFSKKNNSVGDFYLGGRKLGPLVTAMSAEASDMSSWLLMGLPGVALLCGTAEASWTAIGLAVGTYVNWLIVAKRLRTYTQKCDAITLPDFFRNRYRDRSNALLGIAAVIILVFFVPYTASGFAACGKLFNSLFDIDYHTAMIISAAVIILYTSIGGFLAASTTDLIQSIVMTLALIVIVLFGINTAGGFDAVIENAKELPGYLSLTLSHDIESGTSNPYSFLTIISTLAWGLGYFGMPHVLLRFMAIKDSKKIKTSRRIATVWVVISMAIAVFIGIAGNAAAANGSVDAITSSDQAERIIIKLAQLLNQHGLLAAIVAGLVLAGILASTMSTADSQLLTASSGMSENILKGVFKMKLSDRGSMLVARGVLVVIAVLGVILAWDQESSVFSIVSFAWAGFGATFGPVVLTALFWKRSNKWGALAGMVSGGVMVFVWKYLIAPNCADWGLGFLNVYELLPAFIAGLIAIIAVSLLTKKPEAEITEEFEEVNKLCKA